MSWFSFCVSFCCAQQILCISRMRSTLEAIQKYPFAYIPSLSTIDPWSTGSGCMSHVCLSLDRHELCANSSVCCRAPTLRAARLCRCCCQLRAPLLLALVGPRSLVNVGCVFAQPLRRLTCGQCASMGLVGLEPTASPLSEECSNQLSYRPLLSSLICCSTLTAEQETGLMPRILPVQTASSRLSSIRSFLYRRAVGTFRHRLCFQSHSRSHC